MGKNYSSILASKEASNAPVDFFLLIDIILETTFYLCLYIIPLEGIHVSLIYIYI